MRAPVTNACPAMSRLPAVGAIALYASIYIDPTFNTAVRSYFLRLAGLEPSRVAWLDATLDPAELAQLTRTRLRPLVTHRPIRGTA